MKNLFLTSGLILCLACPAFADIAAGTSSANCDESVLDSYTGPVDFGSDWRPVISSAITLGSDRYTSNSGTSVQSATTNLSPATVYEVYGVGVYSTQPTVATLDNFTTSNRLSALTTLPQMTGYNFAGVYTTKATDGIQVIDSSGNFLYDDASTQVTTDGGLSSTKWFARWTAKNDIAVSYAAGTASNPNNPNSATHTPTGSTASQTATYDSSLTLAANGFTAPDGYTFNKWESPKVLTTGASTTTQYDAGASINPWKVADNITLTATWTPINYTITFAKGTVDTEGSALVAPDGTTATPSGTMADQTFAYDSTGTLTAKAYSIPGYNFDDWYGNVNVNQLSGGSGASYGDEDLITYIYPGNAELTATWWPVTSGAITLNSNVYRNNDNTQTALHTVGNGVTAPATTTVHSWYNHNLYAGSSGNTAVVAENLIPSATGYTFGGYKNASGTTLYINSSGAVQGAGLRAVTTGGGTDTWYATWTPINYTITYQDNTSDTNGTALYGSLNGSVPSAQTVPYDDTVNLTSMTGTRVGYTFAGWHGDKNVRTVAGTGSMNYNNGGSITYLYPGNVTLTANWSPAKSGAITLISDVYPSNDTSQTPKYTPSTTEAVTPVTTDTICSIYNNGLYKDTSLTPMVAREEIPVKAGYTFNGFYDYGMREQYITDAGVATVAGTRVVTTASGTDTWYAKWTPNQYDVFYYVGTCAKSRELGLEGYYLHIAAATYDSVWRPLRASSRAAPYIYAPTGWTFDGWTTDERPEYFVNTLRHPVTGYTPWKETSNLRLYGACTPNISGAITLDSMMYASASDTIGTAATTNASASTLYSVYDHGIYTTQPTKETYPSAIQYLQLATKPELTGYTFQGFYTGKAGSGTRVINGDGTFTDYAETYVTTAGGTATWYAHYTVNSYNITYGCGSAPSGASESVTGNNVPSNGSATYGSSYTLSATYGDCALPGYTATGWDCSGGAVLSNATGSQSTWSSAADIACTVHWTPNTINLNYYQDTVANGATTPFTTDTCTYDTTFDLPTNYQPKNGYHFNGWVVRQ